jgi:predicted ATPase/class 3 adenylate cyclase
VLRDSAGVSLPTGLVTFLLTDIEGSTEMFRRIGEGRYREVLEAHRRIIRAALADHDGVEVSTGGDSFLAAFIRPRSGVFAAMAAQQALSAHDWPEDAGPRVRMGLHMGHAEADDDGGYIALALHQAARVGNVPHGGQVFVTRAIADAIGEPPGLALHALGSYWLKDFPEPVQLLAITTADGEPDLRAPRAPRADLTNLPALRGVFVGRDGEVATVIRLLHQPGLVTITGPGGVGKTRLALEVAARRAAVGEEAWVVELAGVSPRAASEQTDELGEVGAALARTIGCDAATMTDLVRRLSRSSMLLVIDNAEHLLDAVTDLVDALLGGCPSLTLAVTSRAPLALADETVYRLAPLAVPNSEAATDEVDANPAVQLFAARARAANGFFMLGLDNRDEVVELCRMLDGLPLALELAAARVSTLRPQALLERVRAVGDLPGLAAGGSRSRHATLHAVLDWSLTLCDQTEISVLRRMAAFAGPVDLDAVVTVTGGELLRADQVVDALVGLVDKSLVVLRSGDLPAYDMLVTIRQAALSRLLAEDERDEALQRHADWLLERIEEAAPDGLERDTDAVKALSLEVEIVLERGANGEISADNYAAIFIALRDHLCTREQHLAIRHGLRLAELELDDRSRALCLYIASKAMLEVLHPDFVATTHAAIELARNSGDPEVLARSVMMLAEIDLLDGPQFSDAAWPAITEARTLLDALPQASSRSEMYRLTLLAWHALRDNDLVAAESWHSQCLDLSRVHGASFFEATAHFNLAEVAELAGDSDRAIEEYRFAAVTSYRFDGFVSATDALVQATRLLTNIESHEAAVDCGAEAVLAARRARSESLLRTALLTLSAAAAAAGDHHHAFRTRSEAHAIATPPRASAL